MKIDIHLLQNFAPSNLNRDDTGAPKDCEFGGFRRARISSQCFKRSIRQAFFDYHLLGDDTVEQMAARTKRLVDATAKLLAESHRDEPTARRVVAFALQSGKLKVDDAFKTQYLLFVPRRIISQLASLILEHWDVLVAAAPQPEAEGEQAGKAKGKGKAKNKAKDKKSAKEAVPREVEKAVTEILKDVAKTPDLALFGRMIADNPDWNSDAACQVAHAISTNRVTMEFDFYTAVDDLKPKDTAGSDMMGTVAFQSACFYRYACLDADSLRDNLGVADHAENERLLRSTLEAFLRANALAIPTGKQNSMAAQNRPSYMLAAVRDNSAPQSLVNAFVKPVRPKGEASLLDASTLALESYLDRSLGMWGDKDLDLFACGEIDSSYTTSGRPRRCASFDEWITDVVKAATGSGR